MAGYQETLDYLYSRLPVFQHIGKAAYKADLNNTIALCEALNHPENGFKSIHVGGTNGKGSVSSMLAAVFTTHGYKTGLYTSPHLLDFRERIRIDGQMVPENFVVAFTERVKPLIEQISPSFFEITVAMAFDYFRQEKVDMAIIEVGMGGRLDSTNVITPELAVVTNIGWDHMEFLGDTLGKIAAEKAGIFKHGIPAVVGETLPETLPVFRQMAAQADSGLMLADQAPDAWITACELKGHYQQKNLATLKAALDVLAEKGYRFEEPKIFDALSNIKQLTGLRGRWEIIREKPFTVADTAHNPDGLEQTMQQLKSLNKKNIHFVLGMVKEKALDKVLPLLPKEATYYFCKPAIFRGLEAEDLAEACLGYGLTGEIYPSVAEAFSAAQQHAGPKDVIYIGGSTFVVAEVL